MEEIKKRFNLTDTELLILEMILGNTDNFKMSNKEIKKLTGINMKEVARSINGLEQKHLIRFEYMHINGHHPYRITRIDNTVK